MYSYYTAVSILVWMALAALCILIWKNGRIAEKDKRVFYFTYILIAVSLFAEWLGVQLNGKAELPALPLYITKCVDYILTPMAASAFVMQMRIRNIWSYILDGLLAFNSVFQIVAASFGWVFVIDENHTYTQGPLYYAYVGLCLAVFAIVIIQLFIYSKEFPRSNKASMYGIFAMVFTGIIVQELLPGGFRTAYLAMTLGSAMMFIHYTEFHQMKTDKLLEKQRTLIETDTLTGLMSRFAFSQELHTLNQKHWLPADFVVFVVDINGLKKINDAKGHSAGDELIIGAADCIQLSMDRYSHCFRTGGDEFVVFATMSKEQAENALRRLKKQAKNWAGSYSRNLSLAIGFVLAGDFPDASAEQLVNEADSKMYISKEAYYNKMKVKYQVR